MAYGSWIAPNKKTGIDEARFKFDETEKIYGPFKFYVSSLNGDITIDSGLIYQEYSKGDTVAEARWPLSVVGGVREFEFVAVTLDGHQEEHELVEGVMPHPDKSLGVK